MNWNLLSGVSASTSTSYLALTASNQCSHFNATVVSHFLLDSCLTDEQDETISYKISLHSESESSFDFEFEQFSTTDCAGTSSTHTYEYFRSCHDYSSSTIPFFDHLYFKSEIVSTIEIPKDFLSHSISSDSTCSAPHVISSYLLNTCHSKNSSYSQYYEYDNSTHITNETVTLHSYSSSDCTPSSEIPIHISYDFQSCHSHSSYSPTLQPTSSSVHHHFILRHLREQPIITTTSIPSFSSPTIPSHSLSSSSSSSSFSSSSSTSSTTTSTTTDDHHSSSSSSTEPHHTLLLSQHSHFNTLFFPHTLFHSDDTHHEGEIHSGVELITAKIGFEFGIAMLVIFVAGFLSSLVWYYCFRKETAISWKKIAATE